MLLALVLALTWFSSFIGGLFQGFEGGGVRRHGPYVFQEVTITDNDARDKVLLVDITGIITGIPWDGRGRSMANVINQQLEVAADDDAVKAVVLKVDSPGGEVLASDELNRVVAKFQSKSSKPVIASLGSVAASGGYYVAVASRWIVAHEMTLTGSIGVIMHGYNYRGLMDKVGIRPTVFKSGRFKDMMSGDRLPEDIPAEERTMLQALIDDTFSRFKQVIAEGRATARKLNRDEGRNLSVSWEDLADGRILSGRQAYDAGFVDELGDLRTAVQRAEKLADISRSNLIKYQQPFDFSNVFRLLGKTEDQAVRVDWGLDLPATQAGRMYFLSPWFAP